ncbi:MAG: 30S ribosomal protein S7 [Cytophagales bacterium]|jgi:small subunit ribosomal protein S7|nr:30S ribosomal protein S7 [Cytophagales bacterium]MCE2895379.1 30S ribosomal protein S7 [Flammeovirgaceae bacterium]NOS56871.1 30S ribosomal protein S7 [Cyclobacteriaceae bacterium]MCA6373646.1 30S ribosomal protein S7 [Cytophagales bacterium]MCA6374225.1 30S ribosomal protein S7 [Cytophagales bacterium]
MRKSKPKKRYLLPDPKFNDTLVTKFVNYMMNDGKKSIAYNIFYDAIEQVEKKAGGENGLEVWKRAMSNVTPGVEVKSRRVGGATFQVPVEIRPERKINLSIKWLIDYARARGEKTMMDRLAGEILAASKGEGAAIKKKDDTHRMAEANKAFSHFRF